MSPVSSSPIGRLLEEISWEGNARHYRRGGRGLENVLTAEVFQSIDFLPRRRFLGPLLASVIGGSSEAIAMMSQQVEQLTFSLLPGDIYLSPQLWVQPDVIIEGPTVYCFVEAKRIKPGSGFQREQLTREYLAVIQEAERRQRQPFLLLVLPETPPVAVRGHGHLSIDDAIVRCLADVRSRCKHEFATPANLSTDISSVVGYTTWPALEQAIRTSLDEFTSGDVSVDASVARISNTALTAIKWHSE